MPVINDRRIMQLCTFQHMIDPFVSDQKTSNGGLQRFRQCISYGLSSFGYDMRLANEFKLFTNRYPGIIDPKDFNTLEYYEFTSDDPVIIPPNAFALARSVEYFRIPRSIVGIVLGKSTYARCGLVCNITALEPEWEGHLTIELSNTAPLPLKIYPNEGIAQAIFFEGEECLVSYSDKKGKYMSQTGITLPRV